MFRFRSQTSMAFLLIAVAAPRFVAAQSASDRTAVGVATLADLEERMRIRPSYFSSFKHFFDPTIVRGWWDNGIHRDTIGPPRVRDSAETATLVAALRGLPITPAIIRECGGPPMKFDCPSVGRQAVVFAISDARIVGDSATVLLRDGPSYYIGSDRPGGGRAGSIGLVRLVRQNGRWIVLCAVGAGTDATPPPNVVEERCAASINGRGRGG
jgi:hypothetical protein